MVDVITAANDCIVLVPQELEADTVMLPLTATPLVETVIAFVLFPEEMDHPEGSTQL
jgi:hypothetical protein